MPALDVFDSLLDKTCNVMQLDPAAPKDAGGVASQSLITAFPNVPCRISTLSPGREAKVDKGSAISTYKVFMRVIAVTERHRLVLEGITYNILDVKNPAGANHHLELIVEKVVA